MSKLFQGKLPPPPKSIRTKHPSNDIGARLELYRRFLGLKGYEFCKLIGISQGSYSDLKNGKSLPSCGTIQKIIKRNQCDIIWLLTGKK